MSKKRYLTLELKGPVSDSVPEHSLLSRKHRTHLKALLDAVAHAARNPRVQALLILVREPSIGWAQVEELIAAVDRFRAGGKRAVVFLESAGNREYLLATAADQVYLAPCGSINLVGLRTEMIFFHDALQWLGVEPQISRIGEYKTAGDVLTRSSMSEAHEEQSRAILEDLQAQIVERTARSRKKDPDEVRRWLDEGPFSSADAVEKGLVDGVLFEDQVIERLEADRLSRIDFPRYRVREGVFRRLLHPRRAQIAVIVAEGVIASGKSRRSGGQYAVCGSETISGFLADARKRKRVKGVVLRVNSPGGSALASDILWREVQLTAQKKPIVVSMGDVAASGGYYIAMAAHKVLALRSTLTGSIGVIGGKVVILSLLEKFKLRTDAVSLAAHAGIHSPLLPYSAEEKTRVARHLEEFYRGHFIPKVMEGRRKPESEVLGLAQGRVWSGQRAQAAGLIDAIGGLPEAVQETKQLCSLPPHQPVRVTVYTRRSSIRDMLIPSLASSAWMETVFDMIRIVREEVLALCLPGWRIR